MVYFKIGCRTFSHFTYLAKGLQAENSNLLKPGTLHLFLFYNINVLCTLSLFK